MARAIQLAKNGLGNTYPNPMVGCVIVHNEKIIGEGYTSAYGGAHAEVNTIASVVNKSLLKSAVLYVTLEPCSHHGKTPPCADLIIKYQIPKIVVGLFDPNPLVAGTGVEKLKQVGVEVLLNVMEAECREHHKRFLVFQEKKRPYIILKWAETQDQFIAPSDENRKSKPEPFWITNANSRQLVHQWRSEEHAILVGTTTAIADNPKLDVREWKGKNPIRVVLDRELKIPKDFNVFDGSTPTVVFTAIRDTSLYIESVDYEIIDYSKNIVPQILAVLTRLNITSLLVEGGKQTVQSFIDLNLWDEARVFKGKTYFKKGIKAPVLRGQVEKQLKIGNDTLTFYRNA